MIACIDKIDMSIMSDEEIQAQDLIKCGKIDEAIAIYEQLQPLSSRILNIIAGLYVIKKADYCSGIKYYNQLLIIQEQNGEDTSNTLCELGVAYQNLNEYELALSYHIRSFNIRKSTKNMNKALVANSLIGIANCYWGQQNLSDALHYAYQALSLNLSIASGNDLNIALNFSTLANIHHDCGDDHQALLLAKQALTIIERMASSDATALIRFLSNLGVIQISLQQFAEAKLTFIRVLQIYEKTLPEKHPKRIQIEDYIQRIIKMEQRIDIYTYSSLYRFLSKIALV